ncbi:pentapeptide repeat-containing protein [Gordonibacter sp.]|uniref:pentapeptide repeat-containing protein n=1 Tax=Gordonibacter sp. TaxID=1968902 RepID=UPI002FC8D844
MSLNPTNTRKVSAPVPANPIIPGELVEVESLSAWIEQEGGGDPFASHVRLSGDEAARADFTLLELSESQVDRCAFAACCFTRASFTDVAFSGCDFSNCDFSEANFTRCTFLSCKFTGADFTEAVFYRVELRDSTASYAAFTKAKLGDVDVRSCDFSQAHIAEARLVRVAFDDVRFVGTSFFRTSLAGVDLTRCQLADIVLSDEMGELRGCIMDLYQAAGIAQRLGVEIKD